MVWVCELPEAHTFDLIVGGFYSEVALRNESRFHSEVALRNGVCVFITGESESQNKEKQIWSYEERR